MFSLNSIFIICVLFLTRMTAFSAEQTPENPSIEPESQSLLTNNLKETLKEKGLDLELVYTGEFVSITGGGLQRKNLYLGNLDLILDFNLATFVPNSGLTAHLYILGNHGNDPTAFAGDILASSNIESSENYLKVYEAWVQQDFGQYFQILFGMHDLNSEFYVTESSSMYTNSNFGIGADLAQTGVNGPSIFPQTAPALRIASQPFEGADIRVAAYNAQAGNPDSIGQTYARLDKKDGLLLIGELTYSWQEKSKIAFGNWAYTEEVLKLQENGKAKNNGSYVLFEQNFMKYLTTFVRYGYASKEVNEISSTVAAGLTVNSLMESRPNDSFGIAYTEAKPTNLLDEKLKPEQVIEATYSSEIMPGLTLQPGIQLISHPSFGLEVDSTNIFYTRLFVSI